MNHSPNPNENDGMDDLLRAFFRHEMPTSWPVPRPTRLAAPRPEKPVHAGRLALALSLAVLLGAAWYLTGILSQPATPTFGIGPGHATRPVLPAPMPPMDP